jgi:hypothetical protein
MNPPRWFSENTEMVREELTRRVAQAKDQLDPLIAPAGGRWARCRCRNTALRER